MKAGVAGPAETPPQVHIVAGWRLRRGAARAVQPYAALAVRKLLAACQPTHIPAHLFCCLPSLQVAFVGLTEEAAREKAQKEGWSDKLALSKTAFKANSKALAETEADGIAKMIYRQEGRGERKEQG